MPKPSHGKKSMNGKPRDMDDRFLLPMGFMQAARLLAEMDENKKLQREKWRGKLSFIPNDISLHYNCLSLLKLNTKL